jgi:hypothetical protein
VRDRGKQMCGKAGKGRSPLSILRKSYFNLTKGPHLGLLPRYLDTLWLFNEVLVNEEKVLYFLKLKFQRENILYEHTVC